MRTARLVTLGAWISYALLAVYLTAPAAANLSSRVIGDGGDTPQNLWNIVWIHGWLTGQHGLYFTHQLFAPLGANLAWMTLGLPINILAALVSPLLGLVAAYNLAVMLCLALNGVAMFYLGRTVGINRLGSWAAGVAFMTAPHFVGETLGHIHELQAFFVVAFLIVLWRILDSESPKWWYYLLLGGVWAVTFYGIEDYALYEVAGAVVVALLHPALTGRRVTRLWAARSGWVLSATVGIAATAPLWTTLVWGRETVATSTAAQSTSTPYVVDVLEWFVPDRWGPFSWLPAGWHLAPGLVMAAFPGFLFWGATLAAIWVYRAMDAGSRSLVRLSAVGVGTFGILELGPHLRIAGHGTGIPLPYLLLGHVPVWDDTLPQRLAVLTALFGSLLVGAVVGHLSVSFRSHGWALGAQTSLAAGCLALTAIGSSYLPYPMSSIPDTSYVNLVRAEGGEVLFVPAVIPSTVWGPGPVDYMYVDALVGLPTPEGYVSRIPLATIQRYGATGLLGYLWGYQFARNPEAGLEATASRDLEPYLRAHHVRSIVVLTTEVPSAASCVRWFRAHLPSRYRMVETAQATLFLEMG
jgi:hypothetical protein